MIEAGKTYTVKSSRKGTFTGVVINLNDEWVDLLITNGKANAMLEHNEREQGEVVTVRRSFCTFELAGESK